MVGEDQGLPKKVMPFLVNGHGIKKGISPTGIHRPSFAVKSFKNLQDSVDAYILNLNTHPAYSKLRNYRKLIGILKTLKVINFQDI